MMKSLVLAALAAGALTADVLTAGALTGPALAAEPLAVGMISRTFYYVPVWAAEQQGFFAEEGLQPDLQIIGNDAQTSQLLDGKLQITVAPTEGILQNVQAGGPLRMIAGNAGKLSHYLIALPKYNRIEDLKGAKIGILSLKEGSFFHFQEMAAKHGLTYPGDYEVVSTGGAPARHKALEAGTIDAGLQSIPWSYVAEDEGFHNLGSIVDYIPDWQFTSYNVNDDWAQKHPEVVTAFLRAVLKGTDWMYENRDAAIALAAEKLGIKQEYAARGWDYFTQAGTITRDLRINEPGLLKVIEIQKKAGLLPADASTDPTTYVDYRYLDAASKK